MGKEDIGEERYALCGEQEEYYLCSVPPESSFSKAFSSIEGVAAYLSGRVKERRQIRIYAGCVPGRLNQLPFQRKPFIKITAEGADLTKITGGENSQGEGILVNLLQELAPLLKNLPPQEKPRQ